MSLEEGELARATAESVARSSYGKLVAFLAVRTRDVAGAEDSLSEAFAAALADWPVRGIPDNPEAWLTTVARRKWIDGVRTRQSGDTVAEQLRLFAEEFALALSGEVAIPDRRLALMFACAHPAIDPAAHAPLILQTVLGFDAATIAAAFLVSPAAMSQRLVRAKHKIRNAGIPFRLPERSDLAERLDGILAAIYAAFAEGWADPAGVEIRRRDLALEAIWLGRLVASLLPEEPEALGLLAFMLHAEAMRAARRDPAGNYVPLAEQDTALWDQAMIDEAEALLRGASTTGATGRYQLEAALQSAHAIRRVTGKSDWLAILAIYDLLLARTGSPVVAINRAIALAEIEGPTAGIAALDAVKDSPGLVQYQPYWAARAGLHARIGDVAAAERAYQLAIGLETDPAIRRFLQQKQSELISVSMIEAPR